MGKTYTRRNTSKRKSQKKRLEDWGDYENDDMKYRKIQKNRQQNKKEDYSKEETED